MIANILISLGVSGVKQLETSEIEFEPSLIELCKLNSCGNYGKNYSCPPLVGKTEDLIEEVKGYQFAVIFQKIYPLEDSFDIEGMDRARHDFRKLTIELNNTLTNSHLKYKIASAGGCSECTKCGAETGEKCRHPEIAFTSLEAYAINVSRLAEKCGLKYINGKNTVTYFGAVFIK